MAIYTIDNRQPVPVLGSPPFDIIHMDRGDGVLLCGPKMTGLWQFALPWAEGLDWCNKCMMRAYTWSCENDPEMVRVLDKLCVARGFDPPSSNTGGISR